MAAGGFTAGTEGAPQQRLAKRDGMTSITKPRGNVWGRKDESHEKLFRHLPHTHRAAGNRCRFAAKFGGPACHGSAEQSGRNPFATVNGQQSAVVATGFGNHDILLATSDLQPDSSGDGVLVALTDSSIAQLPPYVPGQSYAGD